VSWVDLKVSLTEMIIVKLSQKFLIFSGQVLNLVVLCQLSNPRWPPFVLEITKCSEISFFKRWNRGSKYFLEYFLRALNGKTSSSVNLLSFSSTLYYLNKYLQQKWLQAHFNFYLYKYKFQFARANIAFDSFGQIFVKR